MFQIDNCTQNYSPFDHCDVWTCWPLPLPITTTPRPPLPPNGKLGELVGFCVLGLIGAILIGVAIIVAVKRRRCCRRRRRRPDPEQSSTPLFTIGDPAVDSRAADNQVAESSGGAEGGPSILIPAGKKIKYIQYLL